MGEIKPFGKNEGTKLLKLQASRIFSSQVFHLMIIFCEDETSIFQDFLHILSHTHALEQFAAAFHFQQ
jgi:hypothetical protein